MLPTLMLGTSNTKIMSRALNRHFKKVHKAKEHPASKCSNAKCLICHSSKVLKIPSKKELQEFFRSKNEIILINS